VVVARWYNGKKNNIQLNSINSEKGYATPSVLGSDKLFPALIRLIG